jgi:hypothetical protein
MASFFRIALIIFVFFLCVTKKIYTFAPAIAGCLFNGAVAQLVRASDS